MKTGSKVLYHCGENSSHRLLLVRHGNYADSWQGYVYSEATGQEVCRTKGGQSVDAAQHSAQLGALRNGIACCVHSMEIFHP